MFSSVSGVEAVMDAEVMCFMSHLAFFFPPQPSVKSYISHNLRFLGIFCVSTQVRFYLQIEIANKSEWMETHLIDY